MAILSRKDQQLIAAQYKREYGRLVMMINISGMSANIMIESAVLFKELKKATITHKYLFDEDIAELLFCIYCSIKETFLTQNYKAA